MNLDILPTSIKPVEENKPEVQPTEPVKTEEVVKEEKVEDVIMAEPEYVPTFPNEGVVDEIIEGDVTYDEETLIDNYDKTPQGNHIEEYDFNDEDMKKIFFDTSVFHNKKETVKENASIFEIFDYYRKESKYKDVYLPVTNVAVRIYEFNNLDILINKLILESERDFAYRSTINQAGSQTKDFLQAIFDNAEFLTSDGKDLTPVHFEIISSLDTPFLVLAATELMNDIYDSTKGTSGHKIEESLDIWQDTCDECETPQRLFKDVKEILQAQYTPEMIDYANKNYDPNDTLENNIRRSRKVKAKGVKYSRGDSGLETIFYFKDPDWIRSFEYDKAFDNYLIGKYITNKYIKDLPEKLGKEWLNMTAREKAVEIQRRVVDLQNNLQTDDVLSFEELRDLSNKILLDIQNFMISKYLHMTKTLNKKDLDANGNPKLIAQQMMYELSLEQKLNFLEKYLDEEMVEKIFKQIEVLRGFGRDTIEYKWTCKKCGHKNTTTMDPILFVFLLLQSKLYRREKLSSTTSSQQ